MDTKFCPSCGNLMDAVQIYTGTYMCRTCFYSSTKDEFSRVVYRKAADSSKSIEPNESTRLAHEKTTERVEGPPCANCEFDIYASIIQEGKSTSVCVKCGAVYTPAN